MKEPAGAGSRRDPGGQRGPRRPSHSERTEEPARPLLCGVFLVLNSCQRWRLVHKAAKEVVEGGWPDSEWGAGAFTVPGAPAGDGKKPISTSADRGERRTEGTCTRGGQGPSHPHPPCAGPPALSRMLPGSLELLLQAEGPRWRRVTIPKGSPACLIVS